MLKRKKLAKTDLAELIKRAELVNQHILIAQALEVQKNVWINQQLKDLGLDLSKKYNINFKDGMVKEVKDEPKKN